MTKERTFFHVLYLFVLSKKVENNLKPPVESFIEVLLRFSEI